MLLIKKMFNKLIMMTAIRKLPNQENIIYLTFDDGPEPGITEFVLDELAEYGFKATFFCTGKNAVLHPELIKEIKSRGHMIGNHSYSHIPSYFISGKEYFMDVEKADEILNTNIMRPPNGCLKISSWLRLRKKFKIIFWSIASGDWCKETFNYTRSMNELHKTKAGDIVLFHFCIELQNGTRKLLPDYLKWLHENNFKSEILKF